MDVDVVWGEAEQASGGSFALQRGLDVLTVEIGKARDNGEVEGGTPEGRGRKPTRASLEPKKWRRIIAC